MINSNTNYRFDVDDDITLVTVYHSLSYEDAKMMLSELAKKELYHFRCIDTTNISVTYSKDEVMGLSNHSKAIFEQKNRSAIIVADDLAYGIIRSLIAYREEDTHMKMNVFRTVEDGITWLKQQKKLLQEMNQD